MKPNRLISSGLVACCLTFLFVLFITARSDGSRFGSLTDCSGCHSGVSNPPGGAAFGNVPSSYTPGQSYSMTLDLSGGSVYGFQVGASNSADSRVGTLSSTTANTVVTTSGLLTHVKPLGSGTIAFQWTAPASASGAVTFKSYALSANGNGGTSGDNTFFIQVTVPAASAPPANHPPQVTSPGNQTSTAGAPVSLQVQASDPDGNTLTYSATGLPPGLSMGSSSGLISGTISSSASGNYGVQVTVSDGTASASASFSWGVTAAPPANHPPQVTSPGNQTSTAGAPVSLQVQASDPDGNPLTYSATGLPPGLSINSTSGLISGTLSSSASGTSSVSISVSDGTATANVAFNWTISPSNPVNYTDSLYFAQFGNGSSTGAPAQARVYSRLTLVNLSPSEPVHARVKIRKDNGELLPVAFNGNPTPGSLELEIPAAGSAVLRTDGIGQLETGSVVVDSDRPLSGIIVVGGDLGQVAYADNGPVFSFLAPVTENGLGMGADAETVRVGISIMNLEDEAVTLNLELLDTEGHLKASAQVVLPPNGHLARFLDELSWSGAVHLDGTLRGSTAGARHLAVTVVGAAPNGFWSVPVIPQQ